MPARVLQVALPRPLPTPFDYAAPDGAAVDEGWMGCRVRVPLGRGEAVGVVVGVAPPGTAPAVALKPVLERLDAAPLLPVDAEGWALLQFAARYYHAPFGEVWATALPGPLREGAPLPDARAVGWRLTPAGHAALPTLRAGRPRALAMALACWSPAGCPETRLDVDPTVAAALGGAGWRAAVRALADRGLAEAVALEAGGRAVADGLALNAAQRAAVDAIRGARGAAGFAPFLLDGVTGSGKTEVYLEAIRHALDAGRQALLLVPEIGLTAQTVARLQRGLPVEVHAMHSGLADGERARAWAAMAAGHGRVLVGTRSAVFCPLPEAGLIVIDEEHDASYKQQDGIRYHARDLALWRGQRLGVPVVLGSATPALETQRLALSGRLARLVLPARARADAKPPAVRIVDVRKRRLEAGLSPELFEAIEQTLARGEQALVFRNRRGYAPVLLCHDCGWSAPCKRCDAPLTVHAGGRKLVCHHCGYRAPLPKACPDCGSLALQPQGQGTERVEEALAARFPDARIVRVDRDTTAIKDGLAKRLAELGDGPGIYVGTQMLAKGHDLPRLTLSAVVSLDEGLFSADFRAGERLGQLLVQVAGRAGRAERPGTVLLQTHHPEHPWLALLLSGGYAALSAALLAEREAAALPPYAHWALLRAEAKDSADAEAFLAAARDHLLASTGAGTRVAGLDWAGPLPAPMPRRAGRARAQLLLRAADRRALQSALSAAAAGWYGLPEARRVRWSLDVDPIDLY
jgi:primosomal protein N' (replication factor Y)